MSWGGRGEQRGEERGEEREVQLPPRDVPRWGSQLQQHNESHTQHLHTTTRKRRGTRDEQNSDGGLECFAGGGCAVGRAVTAGFEGCPDDEVRGDGKRH